MIESRAPMAAALVAAVVAALLVTGATPVGGPAAVEEQWVGPLLPEGWTGGTPVSSPPATSEDGAADPAAAPEPPHAARIEAFTMPVAGEPATGLLGVPAADVTPTTLAVFAHPWGGEAADYEGDLLALAERGVLAVAMDFRGPEDAFKVRAGVEDTVAATLDLRSAYPSIDRTLLYGHSMGGEVAMLAVAAAPPDTYDYVFAGAGVSDLEALWHSFVAVRWAIEEETGGTPAEVPAEYAVRSPIDRVPDLLDRGVARYFLVHGAGDAPVPVDHAERLYEAMTAAGLPVSYYVVTTDDDPWCVPPLHMCPDPAPPALASHAAGRFHLMRPFIDHRIERLPDPDETAARGTYDGDSGHYEPSDVGDG